LRISQSLLRQGGLRYTLQAASQRQTANPQRDPAGRRHRLSRELFRSFDLLDRSGQRSHLEPLPTRCVRGALLRAASVWPGAELACRARGGDLCRAHRRPRPAHSARATGAFSSRNPCSLAGGRPRGREKLRSAVLSGGHGRRAGAQRTASQSGDAAIARRTINHQPLTHGRIDRYGTLANARALSTAGSGAHPDAGEKVLTIELTKGPKNAFDTLHDRPVLGIMLTLP